MNTRNLIRWAGLAALVAGICFVAVGLLHPPDVLASVTTSRWLIIHSLAIAMSVFGLFGMTGLYARQAEAAGWLGLAGYLLWSLWMTLALIFNFFEAFVLPLLATRAPTFAESILRVVTRSAGEVDFGVLAGLWAVSDVTFVIGGLVFGIATLRAGVLSRRAAGMLTVGIAVAPAYVLLPHQIESLVAVPIGMGLAWLGWGLWAERREHAAAPVPGREIPQFRPTAAE
jgi:hypothetical protein